MSLLPGASDRETNPERKKTKRKKRTNRQMEKA
jgi:hypothetical protein